MEIVDRFTKADYRIVRGYAFQLQAELVARGIEIEYSLEAIGPRKKNPKLYCMFIDSPAHNTYPYSSCDCPYPFFE